MTRRTTSRFTIPAAALLAILGLVALRPVAAQVPKTLRVTESGLDMRIDVSLEDAPPAQFFESFAEILGVDVAALPAFDSNLTLELHNVRVATVLTAACESLGCLWRIEDGRLRVTRDPEAPAGRGTRPGRAEGPSAAKLDELIDMDLDDAGLRQTLAAFGSIAGVDVEIAEGLEGTVTIQLQNTPVRTALDAVCRIQGCHWELVETDEGPLLRFRER